MVQAAARLLRQQSYPFILMLFLASCATIKNYPDKPFVYQTAITLNGKFSTDERKDLLPKLQQQLHDSVVVRRKQTLGFSSIKNPPVYDTSNADKSIGYMNALLNSLGYYRDSINYNIEIDSVQDGARWQQRVTLNFEVFPSTLR